MKHRRATKHTAIMGSEQPPRGEYDKSKTERIFSGTSYGYLDLCYYYRGMYQFSPETFSEWRGSLTQYRRRILMIFLQFCLFVHLDYRIVHRVRSASISLPQFSILYLVLVQSSSGEEPQKTILDAGARTSAVACVLDGSMYNQSTTKGKYLPSPLAGHNLIWREKEK